MPAQPSARESAQGWTSRKMTWVLVVALVAVALGNYIALSASHPWLYVSIREFDLWRNEYFSDFSMTVDATGRVHVAYISSSYGLVYATNSAIPWVTRPLDSAALKDGGTSIAADPHGTVSIAYAVGNQTQSVVRYLTNSGGEWDNATVGKGRYPSLALDTAGRAHLAYSDGTFYEDMPDLAPAEVRYAVGGLAGWNITTAVSREVFRFEGWLTQLALDSRGHAHIVCSEPYGRTISYSSDIAGTWKEESMSTLTQYHLDYASALALDGQDRPHLAFVGDGMVLSHAVLEAGSWRVTTIDDTQKWSLFRIAMVRDTQDAMHVAWTSGNDMDVRVAAETGGSWSVSTLESRDADRSTLAMAAGPDGRIHVAYDYVMERAFEPSIRRLVDVSNGVDGGSFAPFLLLGAPFLAGEVAVVLVGFGVWRHLYWRRRNAELSLDVKAHRESKSATTSSAERRPPSRR